MTRYVARRMLSAIPLVLGIATIVFFVLNVAPGGPAGYLTRPGIPPEVLEQVRRSFGLDQPVHVRYVKWLLALFQGDFGYSFSRGRPVAAVIAEILPNTLVLSGCALLGAFLVGMAVGIVQAVRRSSLLDSALSVVTLFFYSMPSFWLALMLMLAFSLYARNVWEWPFFFPASGMQSAGYAGLSPWERVLDRAWHLVLPALTLVLVLAAGIARYMRASLLEVIHQDYIRTARAKGLSEGRVIFRHALRNALLPVITLLGLYLPVLFSGTVFVETVFAWPGMGKLVVDSIGQRDYPVVMAGSFVFAILVVLGNLLADVLYAVVDPRIRYDGGREG